ncbi:hypothetical protein [Armatimonas sp.]|uniref:hypothetical protein n=1 Tax=Armatimonas sp. TaxID=1872638 RepID=UPI00286AB01E|nr:hypothetical protein [Armatimonas sp.]
MDEDKFAEQAQQDEPLSGFLLGIADTVRGGPTPKRMGVVGPDILWLAAAYAVWSLTKIGIDFLRGKSALALTEAKVNTMKVVMEKTGLGLKQSKDIVDTALAETTKRSADDPILQALLRLIPGKTEAAKETKDAPKEIE